MAGVRGPLAACGHSWLTWRSAPALPSRLPTRIPPHLANRSRCGRRGLRPRRLTLALPAPLHAADPPHLARPSADSPPCGLRPSSVPSQAHCFAPRRLPAFPAGGETDRAPGQGGPFRLAASTPMRPVFRPAAGGMPPGVGVVLPANPAGPTGRTSGLLRRSEPVLPGRPSLGKVLSISGVLRVGAVPENRSTGL